MVLYPTALGHEATWEKSRNLRDKFGYTVWITEITEQLSVSSVIQTLAQRSKISPELFLEQASGLLRLLFFSVISIIRTLAQRKFWSNLRSLSKRLDY